MKIVSIILLAGISLLLGAQEPPANDIPFRKFQIGLHMSNNIMKGPAKFVLLESRLNYGYDAGLSLKWNFKPALGLETGVEYSRRAISSFYDLGAGYPLDPYSRGSYSARYHYLSIPVKVIISAGKKKVRFIAGLGLSADILLSETENGVIVTLNGGIYQDQGINKDSTFKPVLISGIAQTGIDYTITDRLNVIITPIFHANMVPISALNHERIWSVGLRTGIYYGF